jgi:hypothetical protein
MKLTKIYFHTLWTQSSFTSKSFLYFVGTEVVFVLRLGATSWVLSLLGDRPPRQVSLLVPEREIVTGGHITVPRHIDCFLWHVNRSVVMKKPSHVVIIADLLDLSEYSAKLKRNKTCPHCKGHSHNAVYINNILWRATAMQWTVFYWRHLHGTEYGRKPANDTQRLGEVLLPRQR